MELHKLKQNAINIILGQIDEWTNYHEQTWTH
jgi:hypothetical protein